MRAQVLEQSESKREAGYMIVMGSNAMRVINKIGISLSRSLTLPPLSGCAYGGYYCGVLC